MINVKLQSNSIKINGVSSSAKLCGEERSICDVSIHAVKDYETPLNRYHWYSRQMHSVIYD